MGKIIGIISIKGGVGKTSTVVNLGATLANDFKQKVLLVDANFSAPNLALHLGITKAPTTLHNVLHKNLSAEEAIYKTQHNFHMIPGMLGNKKTIDPFRLKNSISWLRDHYDVILIDSSPSLNNEILATMVASDSLFVVTTPDHVTLSSTLHAVKVAKQRKTPIHGLVLNKVHHKQYELSLDDIEKAAGCQVLAVLPYDTKVLASLARQTPSTLEHANETTMEYRKLAAAIIGENYEDPRIIKKFQQLFSKKTSKQDLNRSIFKDTHK